MNDTQASHPRPVRDGNGLPIHPGEPDWAVWYRLQEAQEAWERKWSRPTNDPTHRALQDYAHLHDRMARAVVAALQLGTVSPHARHLLARALTENGSPYLEDALSGDETRRVDAYARRDRARDQEQTQ